VAIKKTLQNKHFFDFWKKCCTIVAPENIRRLIKTSILFKSAAYSNGPITKL
jgi:hypothetical protein